MLPWTRKIKFSKVTFVVFSILVVFLFFGFSSQNVLAQTDTSTLGTNIIDQNIALSGTDIRVVIVRIINTVLGLLGIIAVSLIVYAGFIIMTSGGDEGKVASGKKMIINAVIGLAVILSAFAIVKFITNNMFGYGFNKGNESTGQGQKFNYFEGSGFLGTIVRDHYPFVNQKDVARNTAVIVTFNIPIEPASVAVNTNNNCWNSDFSGPTTTCQSDNGDIVNPYYGDCIFDDNNQMLCDTLNTSSVKIDLTSKVRNVDSVANSGVAASAVFSYEAVKDYTGVDEGKFEVYTVVFRPVDYLGSSTENEDYTVKLLGGINKQKIRGVTQNQSIFPPGKSYMWDFQTGTNLDLSPPHVVSVSPANGGQESKDIIIQIDFDEAIDPTTVQGDLNSSLDGFDNILLNTTNTLDGIDRVVTGTWKISNGYKTVEFFPPDICGQNSCGDNKYCLPVVCSGDDNCLQNFYALIHTATSTGNPDAPFQAVPFSGVYDTAMNGLSTNNDDILNKPTVLIGLFIGGIFPFLVASLTMTAVGDAAFEMIKEIRRQFREIPGLMEGTGQPDHATCISIATNAALKKMVLPGVLAVAAPVMVGFGLGPEALGGMLGGALVCCVLLALTMSNAGGAWDNAKKHVEKGNFGGKGSDVHKAVVVGDTVGDPFKDTAGPSMNILINVMAIVSLVIAPLL